LTTFQENLVVDEIHFSVIHFSVISGNGKDDRNMIDRKMKRNHSQCSPNAFVFSLGTPLRNARAQSGGVASPTAPRSSAFLWFNCFASPKAS
jgi:hypothetical protein